MKGSTSSESGKTVSEERINVENLLHIVSLGYEDLIIEFWIQPSDGIHIQRQVKIS